jgi:outer membrane biosynthesis protein TonB
MVDANLAVPTPQSGDADDVVLGLETAATLWKRGDAQDAIRWVRRAAESAEEAGDDMRALTLARAAADMTTAHEAAPQARTDAAAPQPSTPSAPQPSAPSAPQPSAPSPAPSYAPTAPTPSTPPPPVAEVAPASARRPPTPPGAPTPAAQPQKSRSSAMDALTELASLARADGTAAGKSRPTSPTALRGVRVALSRSKDDPAVLLARVLGDDEIAERGEKNGMVIATEVIVEQLLKPR